MGVDDGSAQVVEQKIHTIVRKPREADIKSPRTHATYELAWTFGCVSLMTDDNRAISPCQTSPASRGGSSIRIAASSATRTGQ